MNAGVSSVPIYALKFADFVRCNRYDAGDRKKMYFDKRTKIFWKKKLCRFHQKFVSMRCAVLALETQKGCYIS